MNHAGGSAAMPDRSFEEQALAQAERLQPSVSTASLTLPIRTPSAAEALVGLERETTFWASRDGDICVGLGSAGLVTATGPDRFEQVQTAASRELESLQSHGLLGAEPQKPRLLGGFAFHAGEAQAQPWSGFGDARFVLPRFQVEKLGRRWTLTVVMRRGESARTAVREALTLRNRIQALSAETSGRPADAQRCDDPVLTRATWCQLVEDILRRIASGDAKKIVASLRCELDCGVDIQVPATLRALGQGTGTRFAFCHDDKTFLGATPERLVRRDGPEVKTEALAGTFRRTGENFAQELLRSPKEHQEHAPVLNAILNALAPVCEQLEHSEHPEMFELPEILHLKTPVHGHLRHPTHIVELVSRLHPTPAVGGVPSEQASTWISEQESHERGWYAGPVGWFDRDGNGDFCVALRSGVLQRSRAWVFAGAGIVQGSEPQTEFAETQLKLRSLLAALRC